MFVLIHWIAFGLSLGVKWPGREPITQLLLMPRLRMRRAVSPPATGVLGSRATTLPLRYRSVYIVIA